MHTVEMAAAILFWFCLGLTFYSYGIYPLGIWGLVRMMAKSAKGTGAKAPSIPLRVR